ncbi:hypothetical protein [Nocardia sp. alder85J]|uniref:hypothetical protein n=1 Tax=Nocardia sp. alder85J TaxID=2862949 RepID=UPI001CD45158|nr:hypothetical protein [Nocardia sp. alder85J]MCX4098334.1 hypothetical protein [Nocardia sp. alder85J]
MSPTRIRADRLTIPILLATVVAWSATGCGHDTRYVAAPTGVDVHAVPTHVRWTDFQGVQVPGADQGPAVVSGPVATGYRRTPAGAALAAIGTTIRMSVADDTQYRLVGRLLAAGPGRDAWAVARIRLSIRGPVPAGTAPQVLGYRLTGWSPDSDGVVIYTRQHDGSLTANSATVVWSDGDWKLALPAPPAGGLVTAVTATPPDMVLLPQP